jgi:hypothetical protein
MKPNRHSSPVPTSVPDEDPISDTISDKDDSIPDDDPIQTDSSGAQWWWPENQLGLEQDRVGRQSDNQGVALEKKGKIEHHEAIAKY